jgi:hypothetical protein
MMVGNHRAAGRDAVGWCSVRVLASLKELGDGWVGLGATWNLLRMSVRDTVLVDIMGKLVVSGRRCRSGRLAGLDHVNSSSVGDFLHVFGGARMEAIVLAVFLHVLLIFRMSRGYNDFNLAAEHHIETFAAGGFLNPGKARSIMPFVQFAAKHIRFDLESTKFTSGNQPVTARSMDVGNRRVDDGRLGGAANLGKVWQKTSEILDDVMSILEYTRDLRMC